MTGLTLLLFLIRCALTLLGGRICYRYLRYDLRLARDVCVLGAFLVMCMIINAVYPLILLGKGY